MCLKSILSYSESFETKIFFPKVTQIWSSTRKKNKKYFVIFFQNRGGRGGSNPRWQMSSFFYFFLMKASLSLNRHYAIAVYQMENIDWLIVAWIRRLSSGCLDEKCWPSRKVSRIIYTNFVFIRCILQTVNMLHVMLHP